MFIQLVQALYESAQRGALGNGGKGVDILSAGGSAFKQVVSHSGRWLRIHAGGFAKINKIRLKAKRRLMSGYICLAAQSLGLGTCVMGGPAMLPR